MKNPRPCFGDGLWSVRLAQSLTVSVVAVLGSRARLFLYDYFWGGMGHWNMG